MKFIGISWTWSWWLWLLVFIPMAGLGFFYARRRHRQQLCSFAEERLLGKLAPGLWSKSVLTRDLLRLGVLAALVVALAGPRYGFRWEKVRREGIDLLVALDTSKSMLAGDIQPNRLARAKLAVLDLLKLLRGDRIGLIPFAGTAFLQCPLTLDYAAFAEALEAVKVGIIPRGGTSLARAIDAAVEAFEGRQGRHAALVLITDGEDHEGDAEAAASRAAKMGIKVFVVGIGTEEGELIPTPDNDGGGGFLKDRAGQVVKSRLNPEILEKITEVTGGIYTHGQSNSLGLEDIFADHIAKMEKHEVKATIAQRYEQRFQLLLGLALFMLVVELVAADGRLLAGLPAWRRWHLVSGWRKGINR